MTTPFKFALVLITALGLLILINRNLSFFSEDFFKESKLVHEIQEADSPEERARLIDKLDAMPVEYLTFSDRWLGIHAVRSPGGWDDEGFDHRRTGTPRDIELLSGVKYGVSDFVNGGFHQFFTNGTGGMAPEMLEWFKRSEMTDAAETLRKGMAIFGEPYPRSQEVRQKFLEEYTGGSGPDHDPFFHLDDPFYRALYEGDADFEDHCDRWLKEICGVTSLHTELPAVE